MKKTLWTILIVIGLAVVGYGQAKQSDQAKPPEKTAPAPQVLGPAFKDVLGLKSVGSPVISPGGKDILFTAVSYTHLTLPTILRV